MKSILHLIVLSLWVWGFFYHKKQTQENKELRKEIASIEKKEKSAPVMLRSPSQDNSTPVIEKDAGEEKKKVLKTANPLDKFKRRTIRSKGMKYVVVEGVKGSFENIEDAEEVAHNKNFYFYSNAGFEEENVVYNKEQDQYGIFTGEILVKGTKTAVDNIVQKYHLEVVFKGKFDELFILKAPQVDFLQSHLDQLIQEPGIKEVKPDIQFARKS